jgi:hypothetical protein
VREKLVAVVGDLPILSVSQKPIDLGENICVGERGASYANEYRQILIGARAAKTEWVVAAEADVLYPPAYFAFEPPSGDLWRYDPVFILWRRAGRFGNGFRRKHNSEGAQWARRKWLIERIETLFTGLPEWHGPSADWPVRRAYGRNEWQLFGDPEQPAVSVKSDWGMRSNTQTMRLPATDELPMWGSAADLRGELFSV